MSFATEDGAYFYILLCIDGSYYTGTTVGSLERRIAEHRGRRIRWLHVDQAAGAARVSPAFRSIG